MICMPSPSRTEIQTYEVEERTFATPCILISDHTGERLIPGLTRKDCILGALFVTVTSLWPHKVKVIGVKSIRPDGNWS